MSSGARIRILLVDDHFAIRVGLGSSLNLELDMIVVGEAETAAAASLLAKSVSADVAVVDWKLPDGTGADVAAALKGECLQLRIVLLSAFEGEEYIYRAVQAGVDAYLPKSAPRSDLLAAVRAVHCGEQFFPPHIAAKLARRMQRPELTQRESTVLREVLRGSSNKEIGGALGLTEGTVKQHLVHIMAKLRAKDRAHAATLAIQHGIISAE